MPQWRKPHQKMTGMHITTGFRWGLGNVFNVLTGYLDLKCSGTFTNSYINSKPQSWADPDHFALWKTWASAGYLPKTSFWPGTGSGPTCTGAQCLSSSSSADLCGTHPPLVQVSGRKANSKVYSTGSSAAWKSSCHLQTPTLNKQLRSLTSSTVPFPICASTQSAAHKTG